MKGRLALVGASLFLSVLIGLVLGRRPSEHPARDKRPVVIGLSLDTLKEARWQRDRDALVAAIHALGAEVLVQSANSDDTRQMQDIQALLSANVNVLIIVAHNADAMRSAVSLAHQANVPVIAYDRLIRDAEVDLYVSFDPVHIGEVQAQYLVDRLLRDHAHPAFGAGRESDQAARIVRILGAVTDQNAHLMKQGQDNVLRPLIEQGRVAIVHEDWAENWKPEQAKKIMNAAISKNGHALDAVLAANDGTAGGAIQALIEEGIAKTIIVTGQDAEPVACQRIVAGTQAMTIYKPLSALATAAAERAVKLATGRPVIVPTSVQNGRFTVPALLLDVTVVDKANLEDVVVKSGFHTRAEVFGP